MILSFVIGFVIGAYWMLMDHFVREGNEVIDRRRAALLGFVKQNRELVVVLTAFGDAAVDAFRRVAEETARVGALMREKDFDA